MGGFFSKSKERDEKKVGGLGHVRHVAAPHATMKSVEILVLSDMPTIFLFNLKSPCGRILFCFCWIRFNVSTVLKFVRTKKKKKKPNNFELGPLWNIKHYCDNQAANQRKRLVGLLVTLWRAAWPQPERVLLAICVTIPKAKTIAANTPRHPNTAHTSIRTSACEPSVPPSCHIGS